MPDNANSFALEFRLHDLDPELHGRFTDCVFVLQKILSNYKLLFPEYTDHSELHSLTVIQFCNTLIGGQLPRLNKNELYVLLLGCYFHDTGMGITRKDFEAFSREIDFGDYFIKHPNAAPAEQIRDFHNEYSGLFIRKYAQLFELPSKAHLDAVIQISRGHRKTNLKDESIYPIALPVPDGDTICMPYLSALLRLADEIDVTAARNPKLLYDLEAITDEHQLFEHKRHRAVRDLIIEKDSFTLLIDDSDPVICKMIRKMADKMQATLDACRGAVGLGGAVPDFGPRFLGRTRHRTRGRNRAGRRRIPHELVGDHQGVFQKDRRFLPQTVPFITGTPAQTVPAEAVEPLMQVGRWLSANGDAVYGRVDPAVGEFSVRSATRKKNSVYVWNWIWPDDGEFTLGGFRTRLKEVRLPATSETLPVTQDKARDSLQ